MERAEVMAWVADRLDRAVVGAEPLVGGMSSKVWRFRLDDGGAVVVRHITDEAWLAREPDLIDHERAALELLVDAPLPTPNVLAANGPRGLLIMSELPGAVRADADFLRRHVEALADVAAAIAIVDVPAGAGLRSWRSWVPPDPQPPTWGDTALWSRVITVVTTRSAPGGPAVLLHRDLHPLNVLWSGDAGSGRRLSGVVDWVNACLGHPHAELGHCRWNLAVLADRATADRFLDRYLEVTGSGPYDPWWDLVVAGSLLPGPIGRSAWVACGRADLTADVVVSATEAFVAAALAAL